MERPTNDQLAKKYPWMAEDDETFIRPSTSQEERSKGDRATDGDSFQERVRERSDSTMDLARANETMDFGDLENETVDPVAMRAETARSVSNPEPLRTYFLRSPHIETPRIAVLEDEGERPRLAWEKTRYIEAYLEFKDAVRAFIPDMPELQLPSLERLQHMKDRELFALLQRMEAYPFMGPVGVRFSVLAEALRSLQDIEEISPILEQDLAAK